jgi:hypothetical protein
LVALHTAYFDESGKTNAPAIARRRDQWFKELADGLEQLEDNVEGFKITNLEHDEEFVSAVIEASRSAISTHKGWTQQYCALRLPPVTVLLGLPRYGAASRKSDVSVTVASPESMSTA